MVRTIKIKRLKGDHQNVKDRPANLKQRRGQQPKKPDAEQRCYQNKDHLTRIHIAKETKPKREGLGEQAHDLHERDSRG